MPIPPEDIATAKRVCANFQPLYRGPNLLSAGAGIEAPDARKTEIDAAWAAWGGFARTYFMAMLNILAGQKPLIIESHITHHCTTGEAIGARAAIDVFWRRDLARLGLMERRGAHAMTPIQRAILADDDLNVEVFQAVERNMEATILHILRSRRGFLKQIEPDEDHHTGLQQDIAYFFGSGRPKPFTAEQRNENYDFMLL